THGRSLSLHDALPILHDELDLVREASNCSQLRRNFDAASGRGDMLIVPEVIWEYTTSTVFTMERMYGIPVGQVDRLRAAGIDIQIGRGTRLNSSHVKI